MRLVIAALAVAACYRAPAPSPPANKVSAPLAVATDELSFLPALTDFVFGIDVATLRRSHLWRVFEPQFEAMIRQLPDYNACGEGFVQQADYIAAAVKILDGRRFSGVIVLRGGDMPHVLECSVSEVKRKGGTVTVDRGVTITTSPSMPNHLGAMMLVGTSTLVMQIDPDASHDSLDRMVTSGAPLRQSASFMKLYQRREPGAALWGMANGNAQAFASMGSMRPRAIDGTLVVTDRIELALRMTMDSPATAANVASEVDNVKAAAAKYVERLEASIDGAIAQIHVTLTEAQIRVFVDQLLGAMGP
jgi:hypothetical protein